jgi:hypothetical protein
MDAVTVGAGITAGAAVVIACNVALPSLGQRENWIENARRERNKSTTEAIGASAALAGSVLLLTRQWVGLVGGIGVVIAWWLLLAWRTHRYFVSVEEQMRELFVRNGFVAALQGEYVGAWPSMTGGEYTKLDEAALPDAARDLALTRAGEFARWRWALRHPTGRLPGRSVSHIA